MTRCINPHELMWGFYWLAVDMQDMETEVSFLDLFEPSEFYKHFADFKIAPMAGNVQIVFFRNKKNADDVIVKFMLNERETSIPVATDIAPFYHWSDVKAFYREVLEGRK